jgi:hypothetical protein
VTDRNTVGAIYLRSWFAMDLLSGFPAQTVMTFLGGDILHHLGLLRMMRILRILKIGKVVRLRKLQVRSPSRNEPTRRKTHPSYLAPSRLLANVVDRGVRVRA